MAVLFCGKMLYFEGLRVTFRVAQCVVAGHVVLGQCIIFEMFINLFVFVIDIRLNR